MKITYTTMKSRKHPKLQELMDSAFRNKTTPAEIKALLPKIVKDKNRSLAKLRPLAWGVEVVKGCNLTCGFCAARLYPKNEYNHMTMETWKHLLNVIKIITPVSRMMIAGVGEPTLHPQLPDFFRESRKTCPDLQLMTYTNGTMLLSGKVTHRNLLDAGVNLIYVDMYGHEDRHVKLAKESGYEWYKYDDPRAKNAFTYKKDMDQRVIMLCPNPGDWSKQKVNRGAFATFLNNLDWAAAKKYGLTPVTDPPARRCDQPTRNTMVKWNGDYSFCCYDAMNEVAGTLGNVSDGADGFFQYWFSEYMQMTRRLLDQKNRKDHPMCSKCARCGSRADIPLWEPGLMEDYYDGERWNKLPDAFPDAKKISLSLTNQGNSSCTKP